MSGYTLICGTLVQESALTVGGAGAGITDRPMARDGAGRLTMPGRGLAGAMVSMARRFYDPLPATISAGVPAGGKNSQRTALEASCWRVFTSHPVKNVSFSGGPLWEFHSKEEVATEYRQGVGIRQDTGARAGGVLYDLECVPKGTEWSFLMEIQPEREPYAEAIAARVLKHWAEGYCWLGGNVARGTGWLRLHNAHLVHTSGGLWPNSRQEPQVVLGELLAQASGAEVLSGGELWRISDAAPVTRSWHFIDISGTFAAGPDPDGYGLDPLAVRGHASMGTLASFDADHYVRPEGISPEAFAGEFESERLVAMTRSKEGKPQPFLPGSGLRGPLRHALSRALRMEDDNIADPNVRDDSRPAGLPGEIFGTIQQSARLLVCDAHLVDGQWQAARIQHHAEDEFAAGPYGSSKFDAIVLLDAKFDWRMVLEGPDETELCRWEAALAGLLGRSEAKGLATLGHLPIGGLKWRGAGWGRWSTTKWEGRATRAQPAGPDAGAQALAEENPRPEAGNAHSAPQSKTPSFAADSKQHWQAATAEVSVIIREGRGEGRLTLETVTKEIDSASENAFWWFEPAVLPGSENGLRLTCLGKGLPAGDVTTPLDEARISFPNGAWHAASGAGGSYRWVRIEEVKSGTLGALRAKLVSARVAARQDLHRFGLPDGPGSGLPREREAMLCVETYEIGGCATGFRWSHT